MNFQDMEQTAAGLASGVEKIADIVARLDLHEDAVKLRQRATQIREDTFRVLVLGEFKRGKSTLLNAMLGDDVLARKVTECTAVITHIRYGEKPEVTIVDMSGAKENLSLKDFSERYRLKIEDTEDREDALDRFSNVDHAVVHFPIELCRHRIELVDSPGLGANPKRTKRTHTYLPQADAVVFVLYAPQFLKEGESHFLDAILLPMGLRNIFFVINGWNLIDDSVLRPEDADRERAELDEHIRRRLTPFCVIDGIDQSERRIFRVNALGALKARMRTPVATEMLEESHVPRFEEALKRFLIDDRVRAKQEVLAGSLRKTMENAIREMEMRRALSTKSLADVGQEIAAIQPKLERLRGVRNHIVHFLDLQSANLQDRLVVSLQVALDKLDKDLPEEITKFELDKLLAGSMLWTAVSDWTKAEEEKFGKKVEQHLRPKIQSMLERRLATWRLSVARYETKSVEAEIEKHLQVEAAEFHQVMRMIEDQIGCRKGEGGAQDIVQGWLRSDVGVKGEIVELQGISALGDLSVLLSSLSIDIAAEVLFHAGSMWIPVVGLVITMGRLVWRETQLRKEFLAKIEATLRDILRRLSTKEGARLREAVKESFAKLRDKVAGRIDGEIAMVDATLQAILERKKDREYSAEKERDFLGSIHGELEKAMTETRSHMAMR